MTRIVDIDADPETTRTKVAAAGIPIFGSVEKLLNAYTVIHGYLDGTYRTISELRKYWGYLANNVVFIQISTDINSALKIFETINERGIGLNPMDLSKNLLFTQVEPIDFTNLKHEWKKVTAPLEKAKEKPLRFLRYFIIANYKVKNDRGDAVVREDEIYDWFIDKNNLALCNYESDAFGFVKKLIRDVDRFIGFTQKRANDGVSSAAMDSMQQLCGAAFSLHYVLLLAASNFPKPLFEYFVQQLESFLFFYIFTKTPTRDLERNFSVWADELRDIGEIIDATGQKKALNAFISEKFQKNMAAKDAELTDALKRYALGSMQQYRTRYLLSKLTQFVDMAYKGLTVAAALSEYSTLEIEHILPQTPGEGLRRSFVEENPGKDYDDYKERLGNLTLFEKPLNIIAGNDFFCKKLPLYIKAGNYLTRSIAGLTDVGTNNSITRINQKLWAFNAWSAVEIEQRQEMLIGLTKEVWRTFPLET